MTRYDYEPIDSYKVKTRPIQDRLTKVAIESFARVHKKGSGIAGFIDSLPRILAGVEFRKALDALHLSQYKQKPILWGLGAHVIKCGLNPVLIDLMRRG